MILFLDFDGVLHPNDSVTESPFCRVAALWEILRECPAAKVVFSTSWRDSYDIDNMVDFVTFGGGEDLECRFIDITPNLESEGYYGRRDLEIQRWLDEHSYAGPWVAIDDAAELFNGGHPNLYRVDEKTGLTDVDVQAVITKLCASQPAVFDGLVSHAAFS